MMVSRFRRYAAEMCASALLLSALLSQAVSIFYFLFYYKKRFVKKMNGKTAHDAHTECCTVVEKEKKKVWCYTTLLYHIS
jgi:hypothetical protein